LLWMDGHEERKGDEAIILRHFDYAPGTSIQEAGSMPHFDGFVWQTRSAIDDPDGEVNNARFWRDQGKLDWYYVNVLQHPCPEWLGDGALFDFVDAGVPKLISKTNGKTALFPWFNCQGGVKRALWDWRNVSQIASQQLGTELQRINVGGRFFLDQFWAHPTYWMFDPSGAAIEDFPPESWLYWNRRVMRFMEQIRLRRQALNAAIPNGDWTVPGPKMLENAHWWGRWDDAVELWLRDEWSILNVDAGVPWALYEVDNQHRLHPEKWVSLKGELAKLNDGYELLAS